MNNEIVVESVRVRMTPDGRLTRRDAAKYLGKAEKTLAMWAVRKTGPRSTRVGGTIFYFKDDLDAFIRGKASLVKATAGKETAQECEAEDEEAA